MKKLPVILGVSLGFALLVTGCETDNASARIQEKSAVYATLTVSEKRFIEKGVIAAGFTPDMVYMAMGHPTKVESKADPGIGRVELWTYTHYYPPSDAGHMEYVPVSGEAVYQPSFLMAMPGSPPREEPLGTDGLKPSLFAAGPSQGGTGEPATLQSYTVFILFENGKVAQFGGRPNMY